MTEVVEQLDEVTKTLMSEPSLNTCPHTKFVPVRTMGIVDPWKVRAGVKLVIFGGGINRKFLGCGVVPAAVVTYTG